MPNPWINLIAMIITSSLVGSVAVIVYNLLNERKITSAKRKSGIRALIGELRGNRVICVYNASLRNDTTAPFIHLLSFAITNIAYREKYLYSNLNDMQNELDKYYLAICFANQLIDLHHMLWLSQETPTGVSIGSEGRRRDLRKNIADLCEENREEYRNDNKSMMSLIPQIDSMISKLDEVS